jgi:hypothetical protein
MGRRRWAAAHSLPHYPASYILIERRLSRDAKAFIRSILRDPQAGRIQGNCSRGGA